MLLLHKYSQKLASYRRRGLHSNIYYCLHQHAVSAMPGSLSSLFSGVSGWHGRGALSILSNIRALRVASTMKYACTAHAIALPLSMWITAMGCSPDESIKFPIHPKSSSQCGNHQDTKQSLLDHFPWVQIQQSWELSTTVADWMLWLGWHHAFVHDHWWTWEWSKCMCCHWDPCLLWARI